MNTKLTMAERAARAAEKVLKYEGMAKAANDPAERESALWMAGQFRDEARSLSRGVDPLAYREGDRARARKRRAGLFVRKAG